MKINIRQNITNLLTQDRQILTTETSELYVLTPDENKNLKNIKTGEIFTGFTYVKKEEQIKNYIEIDKLI